MEKKIAVLPGDGIGEEVVSQALRVLEQTQKKFNHRFICSHALVGGAAFDRFGNHFPDETRQICENSDAILFGSVGGPVSEQHLPKWKACEANSILTLRKAFSFNANFRPAKVFPLLKDISPIKEEVISGGVDLLIIRELLGDVYFGKHATFIENNQRVATDEARYSEDQIASIARVAFNAAMKRRKKLTSIDKANVLDTSKLWRAVVLEVSEEFPDVELENMLVDSCAMQLVKKPSYFDVVLCPNLFGDILSDLAAVLPGSLGLLASASMNAAGFGMYEPPGGSAPRMAGKNTVNPIGQILSAAMMLRFSFGLNNEAKAIEDAVEKTLIDGFRTKDLYRGSGKLVGTKEITDEIIERL